MNTQQEMRDMNKEAEDRYKGIVGWALFTLLFWAMVFTVAGMAS